MIREALPHVRAIFSAGGEPMLIKEHLKILEMIIEEGHADHILLRYNSNQTVIPKKIIRNFGNIFKKLFLIALLKPMGLLNDYIRYPSKWKNLEKNIYFLDNLSYESNNIEVYIHTTLQAYNVIKIPELLQLFKTC